MHLLRGEVLSMVTLEIERGPGHERETLRIRREEVHAKSVKRQELRSSRKATWTGTGIAPDVELPPPDREHLPVYASPEGAEFAAALRALESH